MQYVFRAQRAIPELGVSPGDMIVLSPTYGAAAVTVLKEHGDEAVGVLIRNLDVLRPLPAPPQPGPPFVYPLPIALERCLEPGGPVFGRPQPRGPEARRQIDRGSVS